MAPPAAVLFDFDGTLVSSVPLYVRIFRECLTEQGVTPEDDATIQRLAFQPFETIFAKLAAVLDVEKFQQSFLQKELELNHQKHLPLVDGVPAVLQQLRQSHVPAGIVSSKLRQPILDLLATFELADFFAVVVGRDDVSATKPDPEPVLHACDLLAVAPEATIFVGDSLLDLHAAQAAGAQFVGVLTGAATAAEFAKAGATRVLAHAGELEQLFSQLLPPT